MYILRAVVLDEDRDLEAVLPEGRREPAREASVAATLRLPRGLWDARQDADRARGGYGMLMLGGLLVRRVGVEGRFSAELLSEGDLLRPWQSDGEETTVGLETVWRVLAETRLALLDLSRRGPCRWARIEDVIDHDETSELDRERVREAGDRDTGHSGSESTRAATGKPESAWRSHRRRVTATRPIPPGLVDRLAARSAASPRLMPEPAHAARFVCVQCDRSD